MNTVDTTPRLERADVTAAEKAAVLQLRNQAGWWKGDTTAIETLRVFSASQKQELVAALREILQHPHVANHFQWMNARPVAELDQQDCAFLSAIAKAHKLVG